jgi:hypothetical protein
VETPVFPESIQFLRNELGLAAQSTQLNYMLVFDLERSQTPRQGILIVLRIGSRLRNSPYVRDQDNLRDAQQLNEFFRRAG